MAKCKWCHEEMSADATVSCTANPPIEYADGEKLPPLRYHAQEHGGWRCHDCNIADGGYHHPGCDMERCPRCGGQLISCDCDKVGDDEDDDG